MTTYDCSADIVRYLAQTSAPRMERTIRLAQRSPLKLHGRVAQDINVDLPLSQATMIDTIMSRKDRNRSDFDRSMMRSFEAAILAGNLDKIQQSLNEMSSAKLDKWPDARLDEFFQIVREDLLPFCDFTWSSYSPIWVRVDCPYPTNESPEYKTVWIFLSHELAYEGTRAGNGQFARVDGRSTFSEIGQLVKDRFSAHN